MNTIESSAGDGLRERGEAAPRRPYAVVADDHPWAEQVQALREAIRLGPPAGPTARIQAELKGVRQPDGRWTLERAYWSIQQRDAQAAFGLSAYTLSADLRPPGAPRIEWLHLPHDPYLSEMASWLAAMPAGAEVQILRYVPLRRTPAELAGADWVILPGSKATAADLAWVRAQGLDGDIVNIASKNGLFAGPNNVAYGSAKAAQLHMSRLLAAELGKDKIRVNTVNPDAVLRGSKIWEGDWAEGRAKAYGITVEELPAYYAGRTLLNEIILPEDIANACCYLASDEAEFITGVNFEVDGGRCV